MDKRCFLVCPIGEEESGIRQRSDKLMNYLVKPVCCDLGYDLVRADLIDDNTKISEDIFKHLDEDELVIADITGNNPNVFLEIGYRYAKDLPVILICHSSDFDSPFDVQDVRTCSYDFDIAKGDCFKEKLKRVIGTVEKNTPNCQNGDTISDNVYMPIEHITVLKKLYFEYLKKKEQGLTHKASVYFGSTEDILKIIDDYGFEDLDTYIRELGSGGYLDIQTADLMVMITNLTRKALSFCEQNFK